MVDRTPAQLNPGTASDDSVVHSSQGDNSTDSRKHTERDISRLQSQVSVFSTLKTYNEDDLVVFEGIVYRAVTFVNGGSFVQSEWLVTDGVGSKNVVQIFAESDFPAVILTDVGNAHPLEDGIEYIICAPIELATKLFVDVGFEVMIRAFADESNTIVKTGSYANLIDTIDNSNSITGMSFSAGTLTITTPDASTLTSGDFVNILGEDTPINFILSRAAISNVMATTFDITGVASDPGNLTGFWDQGIQVLELEDLVFVGDGVDSVGEFNFSHDPTSEFFVFHTNVNDFDTAGIVRNVGQFSWNSSFFSMIEGGFESINMRNGFFYQNIFTETVASGNSIISISGDRTQFVDVSQCVFETRTGSQNPIQIVDDIPDTAIINILNCTDTNFQNSLFDLTVGNLKETDPRIFVFDNGKQKNSEYKLGAEITSLQTVVIPGDITDNSQIYVPALGNWSFYSNERFTIDVDGIVKSIALEPISIKLDHRTFFDNEAGIDNLVCKAAIAINLDTVGATFITDAGSGYNGTPTIVFNGGGFTLQATGTVNMNGGGTTVESITITNPGAGYTTTPTIAFSGGLPATVAAATAVTGLIVDRTEGSITIDSTEEGNGVGIGLLDLQPDEEIQLRFTIVQTEMPFASGDQDLGVGPVNLLTHRTG